jgi:hypothetical protein
MFKNNTYNLASLEEIYICIRMLGQLSATAISRLVGNGCPAESVILLNLCQIPHPAGFGISILLQKLRLPISKNCALREVIRNFATLMVILGIQKESVTRHESDVSM